MSRQKDAFTCESALIRVVIIAQDFLESRAFYKLLRNLFSGNSTKDNEVSYSEKNSVE